MATGKLTTSKAILDRAEKLAETDGWTMEREEDEMSSGTYLSLFLRPTRAWDLTSYHAMFRKTENGWRFLSMWTNGYKTHRQIKSARSAFYTLDTELMLEGDRR